jgi:hypothetical protein
VDVKLGALDVYNLAVDPLVLGVLNIYVLAQVELEMVSLALHALSK